MNYTIFRCGTGIPFSKSEGFVKEDDDPMISFSPHFRTFKVKRGVNDVFFSCDFLICDNTTCGQVNDGYV